KYRVNLFSKSQTFFPGGNSEYIESQFHQETRHKFANCSVIIDDENRIAVGFYLWDGIGSIVVPLRLYRPNSLQRDLGRNVYRKSGAFTRPALNPNAPFHQLNKPVSNRKSQAGATVLARN